MRNLKRALSMALAAIMVLGLMVVGASAAGYEDFTDKDEIKNTEAVSTMVSLGVISGKDNGAYDPTGSLTRAEACTLIARMLGGGKDPVLGSNIKSNFTDTKGHWAETYIAYCANLGIIVGVGDGSFNPDGTLTGTAAAKMVLCALGYKPEFEGIGGANWELATNTLATKVKLYDGLESLNPSETITRDQVAQLIYNGVQADEVEYRNLQGDYSGTLYAQPVNGTNNDSSMLAVRFNVVKVEGVVVANDIMAIDGKGTTVSGKARLTDIYVGGVHREKTENNVTTLLSETYPVALDNSYLGQRVVLYVKGLKDLAPNAASTEVVGLPILSQDNTVATTTKRMGDADAVRSFLSDNGLTLPVSGVKADDIHGTVSYSADPTAVNNSTTFDRSFAVTSTSNVNGTEFTFIDHNGDGVVDYIFKTLPTMAKITSYNESAKELTIAGKGTIDFDDIANEADVAKDDIVLYYVMNDTYYLSKAETVSGKVVSYDNSNKTVTMDGTAYGKSTAKLTLASTDLTEFNASEEFINNTYTFYLDKSGNVVGWTLGEENLGNYAMIIGTEGTPSNVMSTGKVKLLLADGTTATYEVNLLASANRLGNYNTYTSNSAKENALATDLNGTALVNRLVTYSVGDDKTVTLGDPTAVVGSNYAKLVDGVNNAGNCNELVMRSNADYAFDGTNGKTVTVDDSTLFFIDNGTGAGDPTVVKGVSNLPTAAMDSAKNAVGDQGARVKAVLYTTTTANKLIAKAVYVDGYYAGTKNFLYVSKDYTAAQPNSNGETIYTYPVVFENGETGTIQVKGTQTYDASPSTITKGYVYEYVMNGSYAEPSLGSDTVNGVVTTWARNNAVNVLPGNNGGVNAMASATSYTVASDAQLWNVEDTANVNKETLSQNMSVAFAKNAEGLVKVAFVRDTNTEFRQVLNDTGATLTINGASVPNGQYILVANGFNAEVQGTANGTVTYDINYDNGTSKTNQSAAINSAATPVASISVPANSKITIKTVSGMQAASAAPTITSITPAASLDGTAGGEVATVAATGNGTLTYEWFKADDASKTNPVSLKDDAGYEGATTATLKAKAGTLTNTTEVFFFCKVTNTETNKSGNTVESSVVNLTPTAAPQPLTLTVPKASYAGLEVYVNDAKVTPAEGYTNYTASFMTGDTVVVKSTSLTASTPYAVTADGAVVTADSNQGLTFADVQENLTLVAPVEQVVINYVIGDATSEAPASEYTAKTTGTVTLPEAPTAAEGKQFVGWHDGTNLYAAGDTSVALSTTTTMTAVYVSTTATLTDAVNAGGLAGAGVKIGANVDISAKVTGKATGAGPNAATAVPADSNAGTITYSSTDLSLPFNGVTTTLASCTDGDSMTITLTVSYQDGGSADFTVTYAWA